MKRRALGQHYLVDQGVVRRVVEASSIKPDERVLEIGTGRGALTEALVGLGRSFEGYELDRSNFEQTKSLVSGEKAMVHLGDAFESAREFDVLVASLPYSRSREFVEWLSVASYRRAVVLLQKDFVSKICAKAGTRGYRGVSVISQISSEVKVLETVGRRSFSPPPKVESVLVMITPRARLTEVEVANIMRLFSLRRRMASSALRELGISGQERFGTRRVYSLSPEEVHSLCSEAGWRTLRNGKTNP